jgi:hypothetical protein
MSGERSFKNTLVIVFDELIKELHDVGFGLAIVIEIIMHLGNVLGAYEQEKELKGFPSFSDDWKVICKRNQPLRLMHHNFRRMLPIFDIERFERLDECLRFVGARKEWGEELYPLVHDFP